MLTFGCAFLALLLSAAVALAQTTVLGTNTAAPIANSSATGTTLYRLAKIVTTGGLSTAVVAGTADTAIPLYVVTFGAGTSGTAILNIGGLAPCIFDNTASNMAGKYVVASTLSAGACHVQASPPTNGIVIGTLWDNSTVDGTSSGVTGLVQSSILVYVPGVPGSGSGTVASGITGRLAYYTGTPDATTVDDLPATPTANRFLKGDGTLWTTSTGAASGTGTCTNQAVTGLNNDAPPACTTLTSAYVNTTIGTTGGDLDTSSPSQVTSATRAFALRGDLTPTALTGNVNDYSPATLADAAILRLDAGTANRLMTGLAGGADGRIILIRNAGAANTITLVDQSTASSAANRFALTGDLTLPPTPATVTGVGGTVALIYDASVARWVPWQNALLDANVTRVCEMDIGSLAAGSPPIADDDDLVTSCGNRYGKAFKITAFACKTNAGTSTVRPILAGGSATSIVTADVSCTSTWTPGTINGVPTVNSFSADGAACGTPPCTADITILAGGGTATRLQVVLVGSLQR